MRSISFDAQLVGQVAGDDIILVDSGVQSGNLVNRICYIYTVLVAKHSLGNAIRSTLGTKNTSLIN